MTTLSDRVSKHTKLILFILTIIGAYLRFKTLDWGNEFLHPDELNIGFAVSRVYLPENANPEFFAYGALPIYVTYFVGVLQNLLQSTIDIWRVNLEQALVIGRHLSAVVSTILVPLTYLLCRRLSASQPLSLIAAFLTTFSIGFIQFAHFATFEMFLTIFYILIVFTAIKTLQVPSVKWYMVLGALIGLTVGTKIVSLYLIAIPFALKFFEVLAENDRTFFGALRAYINPKKLFHPHVLASCIAAICVFFIANPFIILDKTTFLGSMEYEQGVATGSLPVFYTRNFIDTIPAVYQYVHVFPFISGYVFRTVSVAAVFVLLVYALRRVKTTQPLLLFFLVFGGYTLFHLTMYVKWTRYMTPVLVLLIVGVTIALSKVLSMQTVKWRKPAVLGIIAFLCFEIVFRGLSFATLYHTVDTRQLAADWVRLNTFPRDRILSEIFDPNIIPFNAARGNQITLFNMYELDEVSERGTDLATLLEEIDYILLPSDRVYASALRLPDRFPIAAAYYNALFSGELGFERMYAQEPHLCLLPPTVTDNLPARVATFLCPINTGQAEGTFYVFDHPSVYVYKKTQFLNAEEYEILLQSLKPNS